MACIIAPVLNWIENDGYVNGYKFRMEFTDQVVELDAREPLRGAVQRGDLVAYPHVSYTGCVAWFIAPVFVIDADGSFQLNDATNHAIPARYFYAPSPSDVESYHAKIASMKQAVSKMLNRGRNMMTALAKCEADADRH